MDKNHGCAYCSHSNYFSIGGQSGVEGRNNKKPKTRTDVVDIIKLQGLKGWKTFLHVIRHVIIQKKLLGGMIVLFPLQGISDSKI